MSIDRIKIAVNLEEVKELKAGALNSSYDRRKSPTDKPVFLYRKDWGKLVVDVSVPRSLFNNTLEEATTEDMEAIVSNIQEYARERNLDISKEAIFYADIWYLEIGKNIIVSHKYSVYRLLLKIGKCLATGMNWLGQVRYLSATGNRGLKVSLRNEGREVCFYDKTTKELVSGGKYNKNNQKVFKKLLEDGLKVLRYEVKFFNSSSVKRELKHFGSGAKFKDIWSKKLIENLLLQYWINVAKTIPSVRLRKAGIVKSIQIAVRNNVSCADIVSKMGLDYLEQMLGATLLKQLLLPCENKIKGKKYEVSYGQFVKKMREIRKKFHFNKEYIVKIMDRYIQENRPIRFNKATGDIEGVL